MALIDAGGPFPYDAGRRDVRQREGILPDRGAGYYREYTVETPGSDDRGARRIVAGAERGAVLDRRPLPSFERIDAMSGLAALLAGRTRAGHLPLARRVRRRRRCGTPSSTPTGSSRTSTGGTARPRRSSSTAVGEAFGFPDYYGANFDALADCLHDVVAEDTRARSCSGTAGGRSPGPTSAPSRWRSASSARGSTPNGAARSRCCCAARVPTSGSARID